MTDLITLIKNGAFTQAAITEDEAILASLANLPDSVRALTLQNLTFKSYKHGKDKIGIDAGTQDIVAALGVVVDKVSGTMLIYDGMIYKTDSQVMKLSKKLSDLTGIAPDEIRIVCLNMLKDYKERTQNPTFNKQILLDEMDAIIKEENIVFDIESMGYGYIVGQDRNDKNIINRISPTDLENIIITSQNVKKINIGNAIDPKLLLTSMDYYKSIQRRDTISRILGDISYDPSCADFASKYLHKMHSAMEIREDYDVFETIMMHFIWQVKRRLMELPTYNDIMVCFFGNQGVGKSYLINHIFGSIFGALYNNSISIDNLIDERWAIALNSQIVMNLEEMDTGRMGVISGKSLATIKKVITGSEATYRPMGTNTTQTIAIKASFVSNANYHIYDAINDESGMRRFIEFNLAIPKGKRIDYGQAKMLEDGAVKFFKSIDELLDKGYWDNNNEIGAKIAKIQESYIRKPAIVEFAAQFDLVEDMAYKDCISLDEIYVMYTDYCKDQNINDKYLVVKKNFARKMEDIVIGCTRSHARKVAFALKRKNDEECDLMNVSSFDLNPIAVNNPAFKRHNMIADTAVNLEDL